MSVGQILVKARRRVRSAWVARTRALPIYPFLYAGRWHALLRRNAASAGQHYVAAVPHPGAGIGHQLGNWIAGHWFARRLGTQFAHIPFATPEWDRFLGLGIGEVDAAELRARGLRQVRLPLFDEEDPRAIDGIRAIIASYRAPTLFVLEQDQFYRAQTGLLRELQQKYAAAPVRAEDALLFRPGQVSIAVHVRRGDVTKEAAAANPNLALRYQDEGYFRAVLAQVMATIGTRFAPDIYIFSQGDPAALADIAPYPNVRVCTDMGARASFAHMAAADILITSKSSFSYKPGLLGAGIRIVPTPFWHDYPDDPLWVRADGEGRFDPASLETAMRLRLGGNSA
jgi:hypothetical protein